MKKLTILLICCLTSMVMTAAPVTAEQAKQAAIKFLNHKSSNRRTVKALNLQRPILNAVSINERPMVYAFNVGDNDGFVLVSGSDLTDEVIGYSDHGTFDEQEMPDNMRSWLESYAKAVRQMEVNGKALNKTTKRPVKSPIAPMLTSKWNQNTPYNILCPVLPNGKRCATGCTNTAFAQIMYYHKWPKEATKAIPEYNINSKDTNYPIMPALEPTTFDWDKMSPTYDDNNENNVGKDTMEIAKLMLYVGCANMSYYGEQTSATGFDAIDGLKKYFGYDSNVQIVWRSMCNYEQWVDMLYAELVANRPIPFSGDCKDNGHSFIIDGYDEEDYFHVNWGWGGMSDGYFKVSLLDPKEQGTGGSANNEAYSMRQVAFIGVQPPKGQGTVQPNTLTVEKAEVYYAPKGDNSYDALGQESSSPYFQKGYFIAPSILVYNNNSKNGKYDMGVRLIKDDQTYSKDYFWDTTDEIGVNLSYITPFSYNIYLDPNKDPYLTSGDYTMYFICRKQPSEEWLGLINWEKHYIKIHIDNDKAIMTSKVISDYPILDIPSIDFDTTPTAGNPTEVKFTLQNLGTAAYHGDIYVCEKDSSCYGIACDIEPGQSIELKMNYTAKMRGKNAFQIKDMRYDIIYTGDITVKEPEFTDNIKLTMNYQVTNATESKKNEYFVQGRKAKINLNVTNNTDKNYRGTIYIFTDYWKANTTKAYKSKCVENEVILRAGETKMMQCESNELTEADAYTLTIAYKKGKDVATFDNVNENALYYLAPIYTTYDANGNATDYPATQSIKTDATVCAVDLSDLTDVKDIYAENPNTLFFVNEESIFGGNNVVKGENAESIVLTDGYPFYCPFVVTSKVISYTRIPERYFDTKTEKGWTTMTLPFAATGCMTTVNSTNIPLKWATENEIENADIIVLSNFYEDGNKEEFYYPGTQLEAYHPYILGVPSKLNNGMSLDKLPITFYAYNATIDPITPTLTGRNYKMIGSFKYEEGKDIYSLNDEGTAFVRGTANVYPFRALFVPITPEGIDPQLIIVPIFVPENPIGEDAGIPDGINEINQASQTNDKIYNLNGIRVDKPSKGIYIINGKKVIR